MVAFNFSERFVPLVASGAKTQTIRRVARARPGRALQLYTRQRTPNCRKILTPDPICTLCEYVGLYPNYISFGNKDNHPAKADDFARLDGFRDYDDMLAWFEGIYGSPYFTGYVTRWRPA